uniref:Cadherin related family member 4 n=1 Tax=Athene cunicularia TaxID=194338 RepID=A0A663MIS9_ATHCN
TRVAEVTVSCSNASGSPNVTLHSIEPGHPFNPIPMGALLSAVSPWQVTLRAGAELDAHRVNQYTLTLRAACPGEDEVEEQLFVRVTAELALRCDTPFTSAGRSQGNPILVPVSLPSPFLSLSLFLSPSCCYLYYYPYPHPRPWCHSGLSHGRPNPAPQTFRLEIEVTDRHGHNCSGAVRVEVLPSRRPRVTFLEPERDVTVLESTRPLELVTQVHASGDNVRYAILAPVVPALFTINEGEQGSMVPQGHPVPAAVPCVRPCLLPSQVPETVSPGSTLVTLRCTDSSGTEGSLHYALEESPASQSRFRMEGPQLQVSTRVPVLVTVTPVNEFTPVCPNGTAFTVPETAAFGSVVGRVAGTDRDYPPDSLEYSLEGGPDPASHHSLGEIRVVGPLDSQQHKSYRLTVRLTDTHNDLDLANPRGCHTSSPHSQQAVPDQPPVCTPEVQELRITAGSGGRQPVTRLACQGSPDNAVLAYAITGGNEDGRFRLEGNTLFYLPDDLAEPCTFVLLVEVWVSSSIPRRSTMVALVVHVTPRSTLTLRKEPLVVTWTESVWHPPAWFVAVLTVSGILLLATLGCTAWSLLCRAWPLLQAPSVARGHTGWVRGRSGRWMISLMGHSWQCKAWLATCSWQYPSGSKLGAHH